MGRLVNFWRSLEIWKRIGLILILFLFLIFFIDYLTGVSKIDISFIFLIMGFTLFLLIFVLLFLYLIKIFKNENRQ